MLRVEPYSEWQMLLYHFILPVKNSKADMRNVLFLHGSVPLILQKFFEVLFDTSRAEMPKKREKREIFFKLCG